MPRLACLVVPDLPVAAVCRTDPDLTGRPLALTEGAGSHARVTAVSAAARTRGLRPGIHTAAQARMLATDLLLRPRDAAAERSAACALADVAGSLASRVEVAADGAVYLDATGATHLVAGERGLATALVARAARVGLAGRAGVGTSMTVARLAALHGDGATVVPAGTELGFLAPLPIACLAPPPEIAATLARWGVHRLGELARLPIAEVATRLGPAGAALVHTARGEDARPLAPRPPDADVEEAVALEEYPLDALEPLLFVLRGLAERAVARLGLAGIGCTRLALHLGLTDRSRDARTLPLAAPTRDVRTLLVCLRAALETHPPRAAVERVALVVTPAAVRPTQLGLFTPPGPAPERLAATLARLGVLCGEGRVGAPVVVDTHRPGAAALAPFPAETPDAPPPNACRLAVRALRPPRPLEVFSDRGEPAFVRGDGMGGRVIGAAGPWRLTGEWWTDAPLARDYWDLELSDGGLYRCFHDAGGTWFVDGCYD
ncbi:MAG: DNA polymerase Y family protein [Candidatus Binatia bacterium]